MCPAEPLQRFVVEALDTQGETIHPRFEVAPEAIGLDGARIRFQRDLRVWREIKALSDRLERGGDRPRRQQAGCTAAKEDADQRPHRVSCYFQIEIRAQSLEPCLLRQGAVECV